MIRWPTFLLATLEDKQNAENGWGSSRLYSAAGKWDGWVVLSDRVTHYLLLLLRDAARSVQGDWEQQQQVRMSAAYAPVSHPYVASWSWCRRRFHFGFTSAGLALPGCRAVSLYPAISPGWNHLNQLPRQKVSLASHSKSALPLFTLS